MTTRTPKQTDVLVKEFQTVIRLTELDAQRATFTAMALLQNWSKSKIANYLGISRARATQKVDKLINYVEPSRFRDRMPALTVLMDQVEEEYLSPYARPEEADIVRYAVEDWDDPKFVKAMLKLVTPKEQKV